MSNLIKIQKDLENKKEVYILDKFRFFALRLVPESSTVVFRKYKGKSEAIANPKAKDIFDAEMGGEFITKEAYENY